MIPVRPCSTGLRGLFRPLVAAAVLAAALMPASLAAQEIGQIDDGQGLVLDWQVTGLDHAERDEDARLTTLSGFRTGEDLALAATAVLPDGARVTGGEMVLRVWSVVDGVEVALAEERAAAGEPGATVEAGLSVEADALSETVFFEIAVAAMLRPATMGFGMEIQEVSVTGRAEPERISDPEPNDSLEEAVAIALDAPLIGRLGDTGPRGLDTEDWFTVELETPGRLDVAVTVAEGLDLGVRLIHPDSGREVASDVRGGPGEARSVTAPALSAGVWAIRLTRSAGVGSYTLTPGFTPAPASGEIEPNDSRDTAQRIELDAPLRGLLGYGTPLAVDNEDWFTVETDVAGRLEVVVEAAEGLELRLRLQDMANGRDIVTDTTGATDGRRMVVAPALLEGEWAISVQLNSGHGDYTVTPTFTPAPPSDEIEPNDGRDSVQEIAVNAPLRGLLGYASGTRTDTEDWFRFTSPGPGTLEVLAEAGEGGDGLAFRLNVFPAGETRTIANDTGGASGSRRAATPGVLPGEWDVQVQRTAGFGPYTLTPRFHAAPNDADPTLHPNRDSAAPIPLNADVPRLMGYAPGTGRPDGEDWLRLALPEEGTLTVTARPDGLAEDEEPTLLLTLEGYQAGGTRVLAGDTRGRAGTREIVMPGLGAGDVLLRLRRNDGYGGYILNGTFVPSVAGVDTEPNDHRELAVPMALGEDGIAGRIGVAPAAGRDARGWFALPLPAAGDLTLALEPLDPLIEGEEPTVQIHLHLPGVSRAVASATDGAGATRTLRAGGLSEGLYLVGLRATSGATGYRLVATLEPTPGAPDPEPNDSREIPAPMPATGTTTGHIGHVGPGGVDEHDWFRLTTDAPGRLELDLVPDDRAEALALEFGFYAPGQNRALEVDSEGTAAARTLVIEGLEPGDWLVHVRRRAGHGGYAVESRFEAAPDAVLADDLARDTAAPLAPGAEATGLLGYGRAARPADGAWFRVVVSEPGMLSLRAQGEGGLALRLHLHRAGENRPLSSDVEGVSARRQVVASGLEAGLYLVHVEHGEGAGRFTLQSGFEPRD